MPEEPEGGEIIKPREDIIVVPRQNVKFSTPPLSETEEDKSKIQDEMIAFIRKKGFDMAMNDPQQRCLLIDEGLGIGVFRSLEEIYDYVKKGHPATDY